MASELEHRLPAAIAAVTECATSVVAEVARLHAKLPTLPVPAELQEDVRALARTLAQAGEGAAGVLQELQSATESGALNAAEVVRVLTEIEARVMNELAQLAELSDRLEKAAETDERVEPSFVLVIETAGRLLQRFQAAQEATQALRDAMVQAALPRKHSR
jgi:chromosome condensin MukBEF ATPase and DNA-binding subunit MukB